VVWAHQYCCSRNLVYSALVFSLLSYAGHTVSVKVLNWTATMYKLGQIGYAHALCHGVYRLLPRRIDRTVLAALALISTFHDTSCDRPFPLREVGGMVTAYLEDCISGGPNDRAMYLRRRRSLRRDHVHWVQLTFFPQFIWIPGMPRRLLGVSSGVPGAERALYRGASILAVGFILPLPLFCLVPEFGESPATIHGTAAWSGRPLLRHPRTILTSLRGDKEPYHYGADEEVAVVH